MKILLAVADTNLRLSLELVLSEEPSVTVAGTASEAHGLSALIKSTQPAIVLLFQWWMISFIAAGAGWAAFISLLIPPFVTESTGSAADAGIVMAIISLAAVLAPVLGGFADKYRAHRLVLTLGVLGMALAF